MSDSGVEAKSPTEMLRQDHQTAKELFAEYAKLGARSLAEKARLYQEINEALTIHSEIEERLFYPAVRDVRTDEAEDVADAAAQNHHRIRTLLEEMSDLEVGDDQFKDRMKALREIVERHAGEEEKDMFPLEEILPKEVQESLLIEMQSLRADLEDADSE